MRSTIAFFQKIDPMGAIGFGGFAGSAAKTVGMLLSVGLPGLEEVLPHMGWFILVGAATGYFVNQCGNTQEQDALSISSAACARVR